MLGSLRSTVLNYNVLVAPYFMFYIHAFIIPSDFSFFPVCVFRSKGSSFAQLGCLLTSPGVIDSGSLVCILVGATAAKDGAASIVTEYGVPTKTGSG